jgi:hypothetical protein
MKKFFLFVICTLVISIAAYSEVIYFHSEISQGWIEGNVKQYEKYIASNQSKKWDKVRPECADWTEQYRLISPDKNFKVDILCENKKERLLLILSVPYCSYRFYFRDKKLEKTNSLCGGTESEMHLYAVWLLRRGVFDNLPVHIKNFLQSALTTKYWRYKECW